jgi:hypothetical protein
MHRLEGERLEDEHLQRALEQFGARIGHRLFLLQAI